MSSDEGMKASFLHPKGPLAILLCLMTEATRPMQRQLRKYLWHFSFFSLVYRMHPRSMGLTRLLSSMSTQASMSLSLMPQKWAKSFMRPLGMTPSAMLSLTSRGVCMRQLTASLSAESPPTMTNVLYPLPTIILTSLSTLLEFSLCTWS